MNLSRPVSFKKEEKIEKVGAIANILSSDTDATWKVALVYITSNRECTETGSNHYYVGSKIGQIEINQLSALN